MVKKVLMELARLELWWKSRFNADRFIKCKPISWWRNGLHSLSNSTNILNIYNVFEARFIAANQTDKFLPSGRNNMHWQIFKKIITLSVSVTSFIILGGNSPLKWTLYVLSRSSCFSLTNSVRFSPQFLHTLLLNATKFFKFIDHYICPGCLIGTLYLKIFFSCSPDPWQSWLVKKSMINLWCCTWVQEGGVPV